MSSRAITVRAGSVSVLLAALSSQAMAVDDSSGVGFFESKIRPVLVERCYECHSAAAKKPKGGLRVDSRANLRTGELRAPRWSRAISTRASFTRQ